MSVPTVKPLPSAASTASAWLRSIGVAAGACASGEQPDVNMAAVATTAAMQRVSWRRFMPRWYPRRGSVVEDGVGDQAGRHRHQQELAVDLHPLVTARSLVQLRVVAVVHHDVALRAVLARQVVAALPARSVGPVAVVAVNDAHVALHVPRAVVIDVALDPAFHMPFDVAIALPVAKALLEARSVVAVTARIA